MASNSVRGNVLMVSEADTGYFITTTKNRRTTTTKLSFKRYDPIVKKHVMFHEKKMK
jgi:large subunit ribosomal protein L33